MSATGGGKSGGGPGQITDTRYRFPGENRGGYQQPTMPAYGNGGTTPWSPYANRQSTAAPVDQNQLYDNAPGFGNPRQFNPGQGPMRPGMPTPMPSPGMPGGKSGMIGNIGGRLGNDFGNFMEKAMPGAGAPTNNLINNVFTNRSPGQPLPPGVSKGFGLPVPQEDSFGDGGGPQGGDGGSRFQDPPDDQNFLNGRFRDDQFGPGQFSYDATGDGGYDPDNMMGGLKVGGPEMIGGAVGQPIMNPPAQTTPPPNQYTPSFAPGSTTPQGNAMNNINQPAWTQGRNVTKRPDGTWQDDKGYLLDNNTGNTIGTVRGHQGWLNKQAQFKARDAGMNPSGGQ